MENRPRKQGHQGLPSKAAGSAFTEPEMRRWPHPVDGVSPADTRPAASVGQTDVSLYYIHCALSYQNQLLSEIKSTLELLVLILSSEEEE